MIIACGLSRAAGEIGTSTIAVTVRDAGPDDTFNTSDDATFSREFTVTVLPAAPTNVAATIDDGSQASLTWDDNSANEFAYCVEQSIGGGWYAVAWADADAESATVSGVFEPGVQYAFRVKAYVYDAWSNPSNEATDTAGAWPLAPSGLVLDVVSTTAIDLTWSDNATDETSYLVGRSTDGETWSTVDDTLDPDSTSFGDSGLDSGTRYYYRVQAVNAVGGSGYAACEAVTPPYAPTDFEGTVVSGTQIDLSWTASADATGYTISVRPDGVSAWSVLDTVSAQATSYPATGLEAGGAYYMFCVAPTNSDGTSANAYTGWLQTQNATPTIATAPAAAASPVTGTSTTLTVLGADDGGEENLTYLWSLDSCPEGEDAWFGENGTNAAQNTTVTFSGAGQYAFTVTVTDACGSAVTSGTLNVTVAETFSTIEVTPGVAGVLHGTTQEFSATALDQFGHEMTTPPTFTWALAGYDQVGEIDSSGLYTAPDEDPDYYNDEHSFQVTASAGGLEGSADVGYYSPGVFTHSFPLYAEGSPPSEKAISLSNYGIDDHILEFAVGGSSLWYDDIGFTGADTIHFDELAVGTEVDDEYEARGILFTKPDNHVEEKTNPPTGNRVYVPAGGTDDIVAEFPEMASGVSFTIGGIGAEPYNQFGTLNVKEAVPRLVQLTVTDATNEANWARAVDSVIPQLYVPEDEETHTAEIDVETLIGPSGLGGVVGVMAQRDGDPPDWYDSASLTGGGTTTMTLPVTDTLRDFTVTAWLDLDEDGTWDENEESLAVDVHVVASEWTVTRSGEPRAAAVSGHGETIAELADLIGLDAGEFKEWLTWPNPAQKVRLMDSTEKTIADLAADDRLAAGQTFQIPNTMLMGWFGEQGPIGKAVMRWDRNKADLERLGFHVEVFDNDAYVGWNPKTVCDSFLGEVQALSWCKMLHGMYIMGHGKPNYFCATSEGFWHSSVGPDTDIPYEGIKNRLFYKMGALIMHACEGAYAKEFHLIATEEVWYGIYGWFFPPGHRLGWYWGYAPPTATLGGVTPELFGGKQETNPFFVE